VPERVSQALTASAAEPLATNHADTVDRATARVLSTRQRQLEQQLARAEQRLADAQAELDRLGWRGRRKHGADLRAEIGLQRAALQLANGKLAEPPPRAQQAAAELTRGRAQELERTSEANARARHRPLEHKRGLRLEL